MDDDDGTGALGSRYASILHYWDPTSPGMRMIMRMMRKMIMRMIMRMIRLSTRMNMKRRMIVRMILRMMMRMIIRMIMLTPMMIMMNNGEKEKEYHDENQDNQIYPHRSLF